MVDVPGAALVVTRGGRGGDVVTAARVFGYSAEGHRTWVDPAVVGAGAGVSVLGWEGQCSCGWVGQVRASVNAAVAEAETHAVYSPRFATIGVVKTALSSGS